MWRSKHCCQQESAHLCGLLFPTAMRRSITGNLCICYYTTRASRHGRYVKNAHNKHFGFDHLYVTVFAWVCFAVLHLSSCSRCSSLHLQETFRSKSYAPVLFHPASSGPGMCRGRGLFLQVRWIFDSFVISHSHWYFRGVCREFGVHIGRSWLVFQIFSAGMFISSAALLPSSFSMYFSLCAISAWYHQKYKLAIFFTAISVLLGWPFVGLLSVPIFIDIIIRLRKVRLFLFWSIISGVTILLPMIILDSSYFGKLVMAPINLVSNFPSLHYRNAYLFKIGAVQCFQKGRRSEFVWNWTFYILFVQRILKFQHNLANGARYTHCVGHRTLCRAITHKANDPDSSLLPQSSTILPMGGSDDDSAAQGRTLHVSSVPTHQSLWCDYSGHFPEDLLPHQKHNIQNSYGNALPQPHDFHRSFHRNHVGSPKPVANFCPLPKLSRADGYLHGIKFISGHTRRSKL